MRLCSCCPTWGFILLYRIDLRGEKRLNAETLQEFIFRVSSGTLVRMNGLVAKRSGLKGGVAVAAAVATVSLRLSRSKTRQKAERDVVYTRT